MFSRNCYLLETFTCDIHFDLKKKKITAQQFMFLFHSLRIELPTGPDKPQ